MDEYELSLHVPLSGASDSIYFWRICRSLLQSRHVLYLWGVWLDDLSVDFQMGNYSPHVLHVNFISMCICLWRPFGVSKTSLHTAQVRGLWLSVWCVFHSFSLLQVALQILHLKVRARAHLGRPAVVILSFPFYFPLASSSGADPGFPVGGGANPPGGGANIWFCQIFWKNCMKLRKFWAVGGAHRAPPPKSATAHG